MKDEERIAHVEHVCAALAGAGEPITFVSVANRSGVSRVTLYRNPALRALVEEHRAQAREAHSLLGLAAQLANLRLSVEALAERVRRHEEQIRLLSRSRKQAD